MRLKTRRKKRQTNIIKKEQKGSLKCSENTKFNENILLCAKGIFYYVTKKTKTTIIYKRKNNFIERSFVFDNNGNITRTSKENLLICKK